MSHFYISLSLFHISFTLSLSVSLSLSIKHTFSLSICHCFFSLDIAPSNFLHKLKMTMSYNRRRQLLSHSVYFALLRLSSLCFSPSSHLTAHLNVTSLIHSILRFTTNVLLSLLFLLFSNLFVLPYATTLLHSLVVSCFSPSLPSPPLFSSSFSSHNSLLSFLLLSYSTPTLHCIAQSLQYLSMACCCLCDCVLT